MQTIEYQRHTPAMDMYSLGVMLFVMLTGHKPMKSDEARNLSYSAYEANQYPKMANWTWKRLSKRAQSLVLQLIERNPSKRLTADGVRPNFLLTIPHPIHSARGTERGREGRLSTKALQRFNL